MIFIYCIWDMEDKGRLYYPTITKINVRYLMNQADSSYTPIPTMHTVFNPQFYSTQTELSLYLYLYILPTLSLSLLSCFYCHYC